MAKMIPTQIHPETKSDAEKKVFDLLKTDPNTSGWIVVHSLGLAPTDQGPLREMDFVVIVPNEGIICLEVKGGRVSYEKETGVWKTIDRYDKVSESRKSPFVQANDSMFILQRSIIGHFGEKAAESSCPIGFALVFPDTGNPPVTPEFKRSDVISSKDLGRPISESINKVIKGQLKGFQQRNQRNHGERYPTPAQCKAIEDYLRPEFDLVVAKSVSFNKNEAKLMSLTTEQYDRLDELENNPRCLFEGAAGTGKTLLAVEYARRADRKGGKVLFVCFNRLLGDWLKKQTEGTQIKAGNLHEILKEIITDSTVNEDFKEQCKAPGNYNRVFDELYPLYGGMALEDKDRFQPYDVLVMDEAQDLFNRATLDLINLTIRGGLASGTWGIFGDFTRQAIYNSSSPESVEDLVSKYSEHCVRAKLTLNCRNTQKIAEETAIIGGVDTPRLRPEQPVGMSVEHRYWREASEVLKALTETINPLVKGGVPMEDIVILSPRRLENSALADIGQICDVPLVDCSRSLDTPQRCIKFSTIQSFKGLESQVVIIVDIDEVEEDWSQSLLYVGMSRARSHLTLIMNERSRKSINARIKAAQKK